MDYIIVQAGGKGSRLGYLTSNKPKAIVPIENLPMIFHLFRNYEDKRFVIIADYKKEVMREYLSVFANVKYQIVDASGTGTCSGVRQALELIPENEAFMLVWSDLILPDDFQLPIGYNEGETATKNYLGLSQTFPCRWKYENDEFVEECSNDYGVAGFFLFQNKSILEGIPQSGELVRWMKEKQFHFETVGLAGTREFGILEEYNKLGLEKCRPFNKVFIEKDQITGKSIFVKTPVDKQGEALAVRERAWYQKAKELQIGILPEIYEVSPLKMEYIQGKNIYECELDRLTKKKVLKTLVDSLHRLHASKRVRVDTFSLKEAYYDKTIDRLSNIQDLVPFARNPEIVVNGKTCRNVFYHKRELERKLEELIYNCEAFAFIHGDCTFSNMMIREDDTPVLIDPRGYFGFTELYGDVRYDWAKLYYSVVGNYDQFNLKRFRLTIADDAAKGVTLHIDSNHWEELEEEFFELTGADRKEIKLLHAIIWLSLTTYAWQDYDSICGAFYNGLWYLEDVL